MNLKKVLEEFLEEETRTTGRMEAIRFLRRYADHNRPVTNYRLQGPAVDAVPLLLRKAGLVEGTDFKVEKSASCDRTAKLRWVNNGLTADFLSACVAEALPLADGVSSLDIAYAAVQAKMSPKAAVALMAEGSPAAEQQDQTDQATRQGTTLSAIKERIAEIRAAAAAAIAADESLGVGPATVALLESDLSADRWFMPSLPVLELFVRKCLGKKFEEYPSDRLPDQVFSLCEAEVSDTAVRPVRAGESVPLARVFDAPLSVTLADPEGLGNPMSGYLSNNTEEVMNGSTNGRLLLVAANAAICLSGRDAVKTAEFVVNRKAFWSYVRWIYNQAFDGVAEARLTKYHSVGLHNKSQAMSDSHVCDSDEGMVHYFSDRVSPSRRAAMAMFALALAASSDLLQDTMRFDYDESPISVVRKSEGAGRPDMTGTNITDGEFPSEWFMLTHLGGDGLVYGEHRYRFNYGMSQRTRQLQSMRSFIATLRADRKLVAKACSVSNNEYLTTSVNEDGSATFSVMSGLVSGAIAELKRWYGDTLPIRRWGRQESPCHAPDKLVSAVYSCCISPGLGESVPMDSSEFTEFIEDKASGEFPDDRAPDGPSYGVVVLETNMDYRKFADRLRTTGTEATSEMCAVLRRLFLGSVVLRNESPMPALDRSRSSLPGNSIVDDVRSQLISVNACPQWLKSPPTPLDSMAEDVSLAFREDVDGRLYVVFTVSGNSYSLARYTFRWHCGLPIAGCSEAEASWAPGPDIVVVEDESSADSAQEILRKSAGFFGIEGRDSGSFDFEVRGAFRPLVCASLAQLQDSILPTREWFLNVARYVPSEAVGLR